MHAIHITEFGGPDVLTYAALPLPTVGPGQALVTVQAIGVNYADVWVRRGQYPVPIPLPFVPGWEAAGTVARLGPGITGLDVGARVAVPLFMSGTFTGAYSEAIAAEATALVPLPDTITDDVAVALLMQGTTAHFLLEHVPPRRRRVMVTAAAGGVGTLLVQLARLAGATQVIALAGAPHKLALARDLGADVAIDYSDAYWPDHVRSATDGAGPDLVLDGVGGGIARASLDLLAPGGTFATYGASSLSVTALDAGQVIAMGRHNQSFTSFSLSPLLADPRRWRAGLDALFRAVTTGALRPVIGARWPLADAAAAHTAIEARATTGKVLLHP